MLFIVPIGAGIWFGIDKDRSLLDDNTDWNSFVVAVAVYIVCAVTMTSVASQRDEVSPYDPLIGLVMHAIIIGILIGVVGLVANYDQPTDTLDGTSAFLAFHLLLVLIMSLVPLVKLLYGKKKTETSP